MEKVVSKSKFKPNALKFFRQVENTGAEIVITDRGKPVLKIVPYVEDYGNALRVLRDSVLQYDDPTEPVGPESWEVLK